MIVIGTAGHIDHGKTTLCARITGVQTDRLQEEKERGISIELGFAFFDLPGGMRCGVIDVPGHEKFVRQMIAGAVGVDMVMLVVAADEGVMPQTREHLDICRLLGVKHGLVVLTKTDLVDEDWLALVKDDVSEFVQGTFLEDQPILSFSATDESVASAFMESFHSFVGERFPEPPQRDPSRPFKMSIDRVFTMKGFGTVVTGTVASGSICVGDEVLLSPSLLESRIRGIQVHGDSVDSVVAGSRAAINLQGLEKQDVGRGDVIVRQSELKPTSMLDAGLSVLSNLEKPVGQRSKVLVHTGTIQLLGTLVLLDREVLYPGEEALVQIRLEKPTIVMPGDTYILRGFEVLANYGKTLGGGQILDPCPLKHKAGDEAVLEELKALRDGSSEEGILVVAKRCGLNGVSIRELRRRCALSQEAMAKALSEHESGKRLIAVQAEEQLYFHHEAMDELKRRAISLTDRYHEDHPERPGIPKEELRGLVRHGFDARVFQFLIESLVEAGELSSDNENISRGAFSVHLSPALEAGCASVRAIYDRAGLQPPTLSELAEQSDLKADDLKKVVDILLREEALVRVRGDLCFDKEALEGLQKTLVGFLQEHGEITTPQFKEMVGASRKFTIPLGEYFDGLKITLRVGDNTRRLR